MAEGYSYPSVCIKHKVHCEDCARCRVFDKAVRDYIRSNPIPIHSHPTVVSAQVRSWMDTIFPVSI